MIRTSFFCLAVLAPATLYSGQETSKVASSSTRPAAELLIDESPICYLGNEPARIRIERVYGKEFPLNTIFVPVRFRDLALKDPQQDDPEFVPYETLVNAQEGTVLTLHIYKQSYTVLCKQQRRDSLRPENSFQGLLTAKMEDFKKYPNCSIEGERSLWQANVIKKISRLSDRTAIGHGNNKSPNLVK